LDTETSASERRRSERVARIFLCWFDSGYRDVEARVENVSADGTGLFVRTAEPPEVGQKLGLLLQGTRRQTLELTGVVQWISQSGVVAEGFGLRIDEPARLQEFLSRCTVVPASTEASVQTA